MNYLCPTCGYQLGAFPEDSDICPSCGTQFGYSDSGRTYAELRASWIKRGALWHSRVENAPRLWNPWVQLILAGYKYDLPFNTRIEVQQPAGTEKIIDVRGEPNAIPCPVYV